MEGVQEKILEKLSEALVSCGDNLDYRQNVTILKGMMANQGLTKQAFLRFLSFVLNDMPDDCEACAALVSIKTILETEEEVAAAVGTEQSKTAIGTESHPKTSTGTESHSETAEDVKDPKLPQSLSQVELENLLRPFGVLTEENGWTSVSYGADICYKGKVQRIFNVRYGAIDTPVIGFKDDSTGEYRVFVAFEHIKRATVAEGKVQPFKCTYNDREPWWGCELKRYGNSLTAQQTIETFQSITMPSMGIRTLARKKEVKAKRGEIILCAPSWEMDTIDRLCELTPNEKKRYKRHVKYLFLVELDTSGKNLQDVQSAPRVKTSWEDESMPLWSPVIEHWDSNKENLERTSPKLMHDINDKYQSYCLSFADFMRATLLPGYWLALKTREDSDPKGTVGVDQAPSEVRLDDNMQLIDFCSQADCLPKLSGEHSFRRAANHDLASEPRDPDDDPHQEEEAIVMDHIRAQDDDKRKKMKKRSDQGKKRERVRITKGGSSAEADGKSVASDGAGGGGQRRKEEATPQNSGQQDDADQNCTSSSRTSRRKLKFEHWFWSGSTGED